MVKHVIASSLITMLIMTALFMTVFRPAPPGPYTAADTASVWLERLEERLDSLQQRLDNTERDFGRPVAAVYVDEESEDPGTGESAETKPAVTLADELAKLRSSVNDLGYRVQTLEEDPINRGYAFLQSENPELRREGIRSLQRLARFDPAARQALREMLGDPNPRVRQQAIDAVGDLGDKEAIPLLVDLLSNGDAENRREAIQNLGKLGAKDAGAAIAELLSDSSDRVRREAADVLGRLKAKEALPGLLQALSDKNEDIRGEAIASLGEIGAREAAPLLRQLYDSNPGRHRTRLVQALRSLGDNAPFKQEVQRLSETALTNEDTRARGRAVQMLSWFARQEARDVFLKLREDPNEWIRREAERALRGGERDRRGRGRGR